VATILSVYVDSDDSASVEPISSVTSAFDKPSAQQRERKQPKLGRSLTVNSVSTGVLASNSNWLI
jgi:hypothetical protein